MTMPNKLQGIELEQGLTIIKKAFTKVKNLVEGIPEQPFDSEQLIQLYTTVYNMCIQTEPENYSSQLYGMYKEILEEYINTIFLPALSKNHDEYMLRELVKRWGSYKIMVNWLSRYFNYLDRWFIPRNLFPTLHEVNLACFRDQVYVEIKSNATAAVITLIDREREGGKIDRVLLKNVLEIFLVIGMGTMDGYENDFELAVLTETASYYSRKAASWIEMYSFPDYMLEVEECFKREKERAGHYLHASSEAKVLRKVQHELLTQYGNQLVEKGRSSFHALLRDDPVKDLSRMYKIFCKIPNGLEHLAAMFRQHLTNEGILLLREAEDAARNRRSGKMGRDGSEKQAFVGKIIELHEKYLQYVSQCFLNHSLFQKALKEAFEVFCNKCIAGSTSAEFLATFYDKILKNGGSERLNEDAVEDTLEKVAKIFPFISDKDLFAEFYRKKLAGRLLSNSGANDDHERRVLTMIKEECGGLLTSKMEGMVIDLPLARESQTSFEEHLRGNSTSSLGIDFTVKELNARYWPPYTYSDLALPAQMVKCIEVYNEYYQTKTQQHRKLTWIYSLGTCNITAHFDSKSIELIVTTYQAAVLLLFNGGDKFSYADIKVQLNLADEDIVRVLHSLSCAKYKIITKDTNTKTVTPADSFSFNSAFTDKMRRITIPPPRIDEKKRVTEVVVKDRRYAIDASIVRILKSHKVLPYQQLLVKCMEQITETFKPEVRDIKKRIEDLIRREFLEHDKENPKTLRYLA